MIVEKRSFSRQSRGRQGDPENEGERPALTTVIRGSFRLRIFVAVVFGLTVVVVAEVDMQMEEPGAR